MYETCAFAIYENLSMVILNRLKKTNLNKRY